MIKKIFFITFLSLLNLKVVKSETNDKELYKYKPCSLMDEYIYLYTSSNNNLFQSELLNFENYGVNFDFSAKNNIAVESSYQPITKIWDLNTGEMLASYLESIPFISENKIIIDYIYKNNYQILSTKSLKKEHDLNKNVQMSLNIFSYGDKKVKLNFKKNQVEVFYKNKLQKALFNESTFLTNYFYFSSGNKIFTGNRISSLLIHDIDSGLIKKTNFLWEEILFYGKKMIIENNNKINIYNLETLKLIKSISLKFPNPDKEGQIYSLYKVINNRLFIYTPYYDKGFKIIDLETGKLINNVNAYLLHVTAIEIFDKYIFLAKKFGGQASVKRNGSPAFIEVFDLETGNKVTVLKGHQDTINSIVYYKNFVISASDDKTIRIYDLLSKKLVRIINGHTKEITKLALYNDKLISSSYDKTIKVWDIESGKLIRSISSHNGSSNKLFVIEDKIISLSYEQVVKIFKMNDCKSLELINDYFGNVKDIKLNDSFFTLKLQNGEYLRKRIIK